MKKSWTGKAMLLLLIFILNFIQIAAAQSSNAAIAHASSKQKEFGNGSSNRHWAASSTDETSKTEDHEEEIIYDDDGNTDTKPNEPPKQGETKPEIVLPAILPEAKIILPIRRIGTSNSVFNVGPCGNVTHWDADTLTNSNTNINFVWETVVPAVNSNCTVKISSGLDTEESFETLYPISNRGDKDGIFPCGREKGFESQEFILPPNYECDRCTLQWKWITPFGNIYSCSDIIINGASMSACMAKCQNGGSCFNGHCQCLDGFSGDYCQSHKGGTGALKGFLIFLIVALVLAGIGYCVYKYIKMKQRSWARHQDNVPCGQEIGDNKDPYFAKGGDSHEQHKENPMGLLGAEQGPEDHIR